MSLVPWAQETLITLRIHSKSSSDSSIPPEALSNLDLEGRHKRSLSRARQWGRSADGRGVRFFKYGLGKALPGALSIVSAWLNLECNGVVLVVLVDSVLLDIPKTLL